MERNGLIAVGLVALAIVAIVAIYASTGNMGGDMMSGGGSMM